MNIFVGKFCSVTGSEWADTLALVWLGSVPIIYQESLFRHASNPEASVSNATLGCICINPLNTTDTARNPLFSPKDLDSATAKASLSNTGEVRCNLSSPTVPVNVEHGKGLLKIGQLLFGEIVFWIGHGKAVFLV